MTRLLHFSVLLLGTSALLVLSGCVRHEVMVREGTTSFTSTTLPTSLKLPELDDSTTSSGFSGPVNAGTMSDRSDSSAQSVQRLWVLGPGLGQQRGHLPQERRTSLLRRDVDGRLWRSDVHVTSPLGWSQRFPFDVFSGLLLPWSISYPRSVELEWTPIPWTDPQVLDSLAQSRGYTSGLFMNP